MYNPYSGRSGADNTRKPQPPYPVMNAPYQGSLNTPYPESSYNGNSSNNNHRSTQTLPDHQELRNQFMSNTNPSTDTFRPIPAQNPSSNYPNSSRNVVYGQGVDDDDDFNFGAISGSTTSNLDQANSNPLLKKSTSYNSNEYELTTLNNSPPNNPFDHGNAAMARKENAFYDQTYPPQQADPFDDPSGPNLNKSVPDLPSNPFDNAPLSYIPSKSQPPIPEYNEETKIRQNERQRLKQLRSLPRFHYSRLPYFGIVVTIIQVAVFIAELAKMAQLTGSAFQTKPYFNPMLGPSTYVIINMGARYVPCMNGVKGITTDASLNYPCPNSTSLETNVCNLNELCGLSGIPLVDGEYSPHQWYRIITPIFLHAGFLHIIFNLLLQISMGYSIERRIGSIKYAIIYLISGISGFLLGANFTPSGIASSGASGSLFGIVATNILMFVYCGRKNTNMYGTKKYGLFLAIMVGEIVVSFVLGLLPGLDNFSHIGGFAIGLLTSIILLQDPYFVYEDGIITYHSKVSVWQQFLNNWNPMYNFQDKIRSRFLIWIGVRVICFILVVVYFVLISNNFFEKEVITEANNCSWCKYISCIPVNNWCEMGTLQVQNQSSSSSDSSTNSDNDSTQSDIPDSIENSGSSSPTKRSLDTFFQLPEPLGGNHIDSGIPDVHSIQVQNIGLAFFIVMGLITVRFLKTKRRDSV